MHQDTSIYVARLAPGVSVEHLIQEGRGGYFYLIEGDVQLNGERMATGDAAYITSDGLLRVQGRATTELLLVDTPR